MKIGLTGPQDFLALLVRRKWWVIFPFIVLSCAVALLTFVLPRTYVSETLILVRPRDVPQDFVKDLIAGTAEERLKQIQETITSRTILVQIIREFGDRMPDFKGLNMDEQVLRIRSQIAIILQTERSSNGKDTLPLSYFRIQYQNRDPELAQKIAGKLTTLFIDQDNKTRETQVFGTTEFLSAELEKVTNQMDESSAKLKEIKAGHQFELPNQLQSNLMTLDRLNLQKQAVGEALDRNATIRLNLETQLAQTPEFLPKLITPVQAQAAAVAANPLAVNPLVEEYRKVEAEHSQAAARYSPKHPDVQAAQARLERLKQQMSPELLAAAEAPVNPAAVSTAKDVKDGNGAKDAKDATKDAKDVPAAPAAPAGTETSPLYQKLMADLEQVKTELEIRQKERVLVEADIAKYSHRVEQAPKAEQDIGDVQRLNDDLKKQYEDLKNKLSQARLAESLENKQKGSQFVIIDPANYPMIPTKPDKATVLLGGVVASLALAIAFAVAIDLGRQRIWTQSQIEGLWGVPVLIDIPAILTDADLAAAKKKRMTFAMYSLAGAIVYTFCLYAVYLKHNFILRQLDPVLQKLVYKQ